MSSIMYTPFHLRKIQVSNRLVASAMFEYGAENGKITEKITERYLSLADGGDGLIITGMHAVSAASSVAPIMVNTEYDHYVADMSYIANTVHEKGGKIIVQLQHCGEKTSTADDYDKFAVCEKKVSENCIYHEATKDELHKVAVDFANSALRCKEAGVDGVQIHGAHSYLINSFLSPSTNYRTDEYGGKIENRGIDFIEVSSGMVMDNSIASFTPVVRSENQAPFLKYASQLASQVAIPVISVCGYRTPDMVKKALSETKISAVSFGRPLVREPNLPNRWKKDRRPAMCISCNRCCNSFGDKIITCQVAKSQSKETNN